MPDASAFTLHYADADSTAYATRDGTAKAGEDYTATRGTLTFAVGDMEKTVEVPILDDALDEGEETFTLKLTAASGAAIDDGEATGTIENSDPLQKMWLSRFGRTVADHVTAAVADRLAGPLAGAQVTVGGQTMNLAELEDGAWLGRTLTSIAQVMGAPSGPAPDDDPGSSAGAGPWPGTDLGRAEPPTATSAPGRLPAGRDLLLGSAFHVATHGERDGPGLAAWGRVTVGGFDGEAPADAGNVRIDGNVTTGIIGTDAEWTRLEITDTVFARNVRNYARQCVFHALLLGHISADDLRESTDIWSLVTATGSRRAPWRASPRSRRPAGRRRRRRLPSLRRARASCTSNAPTPS